MLEVYQLLADFDDEKNSTFAFNGQIGIKQFLNETV
jgi:hypothetical protein